MFLPKGNGTVICFIFELKNMKSNDYPKVYLYRQVVQAKLYMDNHYSEAIQLNSISNEAYFSKFHFLRLFKSMYGKTPHQYLLNLRVEKAKNFLKEGRPVTEVCTAVGFESPTSFSTLFKRIVGVSPSLFIKQHVELKTQVRENPMNFVPSCFASQHGWE